MEFSEHNLEMVMLGCILAMMIYGTFNVSLQWDELFIILEEIDVENLTGDGLQCNLLMSGPFIGITRSDWGSSWTTPNSCDRQTVIAYFNDIPIYLPWCQF